LAYRDLFRSELDSTELSEIRDTVNRGWPLGGERFKDQIERALACAARPPKRGRPARSVMPQGEPFDWWKSYTDNHWKASRRGL